MDSYVMKRSTQPWKLLNSIFLKAFTKWNLNQKIEGRCDVLSTTSMLRISLTTKARAISENCSSNLATSNPWSFKEIPSASLHLYAMMIRLVSIKSMVQFVLRGLSMKWMSLRLCPVVPDYLWSTHLRKLREKCKKSERQSDTKLQKSDVTFMSRICHQLSRKKKYWTSSSGLARLKT